MRSKLQAVALLLSVGMLAGVCLAGAQGVPEAAQGFAGMISAKVIEASKDSAKVEVTAIDTTYKHSKAKDPEALKGRTVVLRVKPERYSKKPGYADLVRKFFAQLKPGDAEKFDVKHEGGDGLAFMELTEAQRKRAEESK